MRPFLFRLSVRPSVVDCSPKNYLYIESIQAPVSKRLEVEAPAEMNVDIFRRVLERKTPARNFPNIRFHVNG